MKSARALLTTASVVTALLYASGSYANVVVMDLGVTRSYDCHGGEAMVNGNDNNLTFRNCASVTISGNGNKIAAGTAVALTVAGNDNEVRYAAGPDGRQPQVTNVGNNNSVTAAAGPSSSQFGAAGNGPSTSSKTTDGSAPTTVEASPGRASLSAGNRTASAGGDVVVDGIGLRQSYDCNGGTAAISGSDNVLKLRRCKQISIQGNDNTIDAGEVEAISVFGSDNRVTWTRRADGRKPKVSNMGHGNSVGPSKR